MMSRKLRLNVEDCRLRLATNHGSTVMKRTSIPAGTQSIVGIDRDSPYNRLIVQFSRGAGRNVDDPGLRHAHAVGDVLARAEWHRMAARKRVGCGARRLAGLR
jgi:hypothetical protein